VPTLNIVFTGTESSFFFIEILVEWTRTFRLLVSQLKSARKIKKPKQIKVNPKCDSSLKH
jgi:hypothetical protein